MLWRLEVCVILLVSTFKISKAGCCFSAGIDAFMKPCCLQTHAAKDRHGCNVIDRPEGSVNYTTGGCPTTAQAAFDMLRHRGSDTIPDEMQEAPKKAEGCCYSYGFSPRMVPCCLQLAQSTSRSLCRPGSWVLIQGVTTLLDTSFGDRVEFTAGVCPSTAEEAAKMSQKKPPEAGWMTKSTWLIADNVAQNGFPVITCFAMVAILSLGIALVVVLRKKLTHESLQESDDSSMREYLSLTT